MKIKDYKCKCGENDFFFDDKGNQKGIYCSYCGRWLKWASKDEQNLDMKQETILDKIRAEIEKLEYLNIEDGSDGYDKYIEQYEVLKIIDEYKTESLDARSRENDDLERRG